MGLIALILSIICPIFLYFRRNMSLFYLEVHKLQSKNMAYMYIWKMSSCIVG